MNTHQPPPGGKYVAHKMFGILASRAKKLDDPRINTNNFVNRIRGEAPGITWEITEVLLKPIEHYCDHKNLPLLSALVVLSDGPHISFPAESFSKKLTEWRSRTSVVWLGQKNGVPFWEFPLTESLKDWHRRYWRKTSQVWQKIDTAMAEAEFRQWLENREYGRFDLEDDRFEWPSTVAHPHPGTGKILPIEHREGRFAYVGYHVGKTNGKPDDDRKETLDWIFHSKLPHVNSDSYMAEFGDPKSCQRLQKMVNFLAAQARNYSRNDMRDYSMAIGHYIQDLEYLYHRYYVGKCDFHTTLDGFEWPDLSDLQAELVEFEQQKLQDELQNELRRLRLEEWRIAEESAATKKQQDELQEELQKELRYFRVLEYHLKEREEECANKPPSEAKWATWILIIIATAIALLWLLS
ncbi:MAG: hypothetical protein OXE47_11250 [Gammaproteobacteria bacterium]|nr:hypothetical protein [Gammaproteobacteria bacterium]